MEVFKKIIFAILLILIIPVVSAETFNDVTILGDHALSFRSNVSFNNFNLSDISNICLNGDCRTQWPTSGNGTAGSNTGIIGSFSLDMNYLNTIYYPTSNPYGYYNSTNLNINNYYLKSNPYGYYNSTTLNNNNQLSNGNSYYNSTTLNNNNQISNGNNYWNNTFATFNKTYADTLYQSQANANGNWSNIQTNGNNLASNWTYIQGLATNDTTFVKKSGDTMSGDLNLGNNAITNISNISFGVKYPISEINTPQYSLVHLDGYMDSPFFSFGEYQNFLLQTEAFATTWVGTNIGTVTSNSAIDPTGTQLAENINSLGTNSAIRQGVINNSLSNWTFSIYLKAQNNDNPTVTLRIDTDIGNGQDHNFTITNAWQRYAITENINFAHAYLNTSILTNGYNISVFAAMLDPVNYVRPYGGAQTTSATTTLTRTARLFSALNVLSSISVTSISASSALTQTITSLTTTPTDGLVSTDTTTATSASPVQMSPRIRLSGTAWNGTASVTNGWTIQNLPFNGTSMKLMFGYNNTNSTGLYTNFMNLSSNGSLDLGAGINVSGVVSLTGPIANTTSIQKTLCTISVPGITTSNIDCVWPVQWSDTNYVVSGMLLDSQQLDLDSLTVRGIILKNTTEIQVRVSNSNANPRGGVLHLIAVKL